MFNSMNTYCAPPELAKFLPIHLIGSLTLQDPFQLVIANMENLGFPNTAVQSVFNPLSQIVSQLELYSQLQLSLWSDPITFSVPKSTSSVIFFLKKSANFKNIFLLKTMRFC